MGKAFISFGGTTVLLAIGYATVVATSTQGSHWSFTLLLVLLVVAGLGSIVTGIIWSVEWYKNKRKEKITSMGKVGSGQEKQLEPLELIDSFPKDNEAITTEDVKKIFLKFSKPIDRSTERYIQNYFIRTHSGCQWNIGGWIQYSEDDTKLIWHVREKSLQNKNQYGPIDEDYPTFEILIGVSANEEWRVAATDGSKLSKTIIRVKIQKDDT